MAAGSLRSTVQSGLVGRERELATLRAALDAAAGGRGRLWLVGGEAGIGKTRLLEAVSEAAGPTETRVLWGRCWEGGGAPVFWPWAQVLRAAMAGVSANALATRLGHGADDVVSLVPELGLRSPGAAPAPFSETPGGRFRLFDSVAAFLVRTAAEAPLLVVLDDLHAADEASLLLLEFVAAEAPRTRLAVIGAYRDAEVVASPRLSQLLSGVARHGHRLTLSGLDRAGVESLLEAATDGPARPDLVARVQEVTDGNPFLVKEVARLLAGRRPPGPGDRLPLPEEAHAIVAHRLAPVAEPLRRVLGAAAILGRDFDVTCLAALTTAAPADLVDALGEARRQGVVEESGAGRWSFAHALLCEVLVDELAPSTRADLHRRAADALEPGHRPAAVARLAAIAHHRYEAARTGEDTGAAQACAAAGSQAMAALAFEDAASWYERALEVLSVAKDHDRRRYDLLIALRNARLRASQFDAAWDAQSEALELARSLGSAELLAEAALGSEVLRRPEQETAALLETVLIGMAESDSALRARLLASLSNGLLFTCPESWRRSEAMGNEAVAMARRTGDPDALLTVLLRWHRCQWEWDPVGVEDRLQVADEALRLSVAAGRAGEWARAMIRGWRFCDLLDMGQIAAARAEADDAFREAQRLRLPASTSVATFLQAALALLRSDLDVALDLARQGFTALEEFDSRLAAYTVAIARQKGELLAVRQSLRDVVSPPPSSSTGPYWHLSFRAEQVLSTVELGEESGNQDLQAVVTDALSLPGPPLDPDVLVRLAQASWLLGAADHADALYELLLPYTGRLVNYQIIAAPLGAADRYLGQLAFLLSRHHEAEAHFEAAHAEHRRWGAPGLLAHGQADHARMLLLRDGPGDRARVGELAAEAAAGFRSLRIPYYAERASKLAADAGLHPTCGPPPLAPERHVLREEGEYWCLAYAGREVRLRDSKGVRYLVRLLRAPGRELHVLDLTGGGSRVGGVVVEGHAGALLDPAAKAAYRRRLDELDAEADEADDAHDLARAERVRLERDFLVAELAAAVGLGGRDRVAASATERARQSVSKGVRGAITRLGQADPVLGRHLEATVRTGTYCSYQPDPRLPISWGEP